MINEDKIIIFSSNRLSGHFMLIRKVMILKALRIFYYDSQNVDKQ